MQTLFFKSFLGSLDPIVRIFLITGTAFGNSNFLQHLSCFFVPFLTIRIAESIGSCILFPNLFLTIFILLNKRSTSAFELGRIIRLTENVAISLNGFSPKATL